MSVKDIKPGETFCKYFINKYPETWYDKFLNLLVKRFKLSNQKELTDLLSKCVEKRKKYLFKNVRFNMTGKDKACSKRFLLIKLIRKQINLQDLKDYLEDENA